MQMVIRQKRYRPPTRHLSYQGLLKIIKGIFHVVEDALPFLLLFMPA